MGKGKAIGTCALCKRSEVELLGSHIIPKLVYRRIKSFDNSRFRNYYNINAVFQDGEKKSMLCSECEGFFNRFETTFANEFLDSYLNKAVQPRKATAQMNEFINSLNWRIIYDDLYVFKSFESIEKSEAQHFFDLEAVLCDYLNDIREGRKPQKQENIKNYIFYLNDLGFNYEIITALKPSTFGYCFNSDYKSKYLIMTYFLGIILITVYEPRNVLILTSLLESFKRRFITGRIKNIVTEEILWQYNHMMKQKPVNEKIMDNGLREKIKERYKK
jgi:hypothetical protein